MYEEFEKVSVDCTTLLYLQTGDTSTVYSIEMVLLHGSLQGSSESRNLLYRYIYGGHFGLTELISNLTGVLYVSAE